jgi:hypothetical protein
VWIAASGLAAAIVIMVAQRVPIPVVKAPTAGGVTLGVLNAYAIRSAGDLDDMLARTSPTILPDVERSGGALRALSKE